MQKIMFDDNFHLTRAVQEGWKNMTRRIAKSEKPRYKVGEIVAVAQKYSDFRWPAPQRSDFQEILRSAGWNNKMFVRADLMPTRIRITDIKVEMLQDISEEDCLREGVIRYTCNLYEFRGICYSFDGDKARMGTYLTARDAFAALIKKMAGKKAWDDNPRVFVYKFELVK